MKTSPATQTQPIACMQLHASQVLGGARKCTFRLFCRPTGIPHVGERPRIYAHERHFGGKPISTILLRWTDKNNRQTQFIENHNKQN